MSKLDTENLDADKLRNLLSGMIKKQLLEMFDNVYKEQGKDIIENVLGAISETEIFVISKTQMKPEKTVDNEVTDEQMVHRIENPAVSNIDLKRIPYDTDKPAGWKKMCNRGCVDRFADTAIFSVK